ncbi:protein of unknown function [Xenorhabdus bovienii]|uniref:Uncharacterized protein n=1 Tax=Xenorhabdus bovienii TaxID=40576 RepID=A0A0B6X518_XENBV|nr:protein of unknown function [Xenorhabdus bovienii]
MIMEGSNHYLTRKIIEEKITLKLKENIPICHLTLWQECVMMRNIMFC